ncbi:1197_t:CDS:10 [Scutellospora calospora]|uniref:1197_t:CDS:1 n=1 Tax=Scutellospora calospora TaxID=85575 RepID=A0ACA9JXT7_9GLOM|nr:1197_t:CDS:10 [Scutellospora calospora]
MNFRIKTYYIWIPCAKVIEHSPFLLSSNTRIAQQLVPFLCIRWWTELYSPKSQEQRTNAERLLDIAFPTFSETSTVRANGASPLGVKIHSPLETSIFCRWLLEKSTSPYAQMFAAARLKGLVLDHYSMFSMSQKIELRNFVLNYMAQHPDYQPFVLSSLAQLFATITKVGWFEGEEFKNVTKDVSNFIQSTPDHIIVGLQILSIVVAEMNQQSPRNLTKQRKTAIGFRDTALLEAFQLGLVVLRRLLNGEILFANDLQEHKSKEYCLTSLRNCLAFDFIGTTPDESGEDVGSIQVTTSWRSTIEDPSFLQIMFEAYKQFQPPHSSQVMEVIVQISSIRRSLFNEEERSKFLYGLMKGIREILIGNIGLSDLNNYHEFCRLLSRFRSTYQLSEISEKSGYNEWIDLVADFSIKGFNNWQLTHTFITSKIESVETTLEGAIDDPLENEDALIGDLEMFANIARCKYDEANVAIINSFNPIAQQFQALLQQVNTGVIHDYLTILDVIETKFAWLVYMIGGLIGGRQTYVSTEDQDLIDGELTCKVVNLLTAIKSWNGPRGNDTGYEKLELAFLYFFQQFRKSYIGESAQKISKVYRSNLNIWAQCSKIIQRTVTLFNDLAGGYSSVRLLRKIPTTQFIIQKHTVEDFPFLDTSNNLRSRVVYYSALSRILFADDNVERDFEEFVRPWDATMAQLGTLNSFQAFRQPAVKILCRALEAWSDDALAISILKFFLEFVNNRTQRLNFDISSPNGILLFRETSKVISTYGHQIKNRPLMSLDKYVEKYKGISICFNILTKSFAGRYVNFGVFALYGDNALEVALKTSFDMMLSIPLEDILAYPKISKALFDWLDTFTNEYMMTLPNMDSDCSSACNAIDHLCTFVFQQSAMQKPKQHWLLVYLNEYPTVLPTLFVANFNVVLFEERQNQWSLSRPLLCLILLNQDYLNKYTENILQHQLPERREALKKAMKTLMEDVDFNLTSKNRDRFTQNLNTFKRELTNENVILVPPPMDAKMIM